MIKIPFLPIEVLIWGINNWQLFQPLCPAYVSTNTNQSFRYPGQSWYKDLNTCTAVWKQQHSDNVSLTKELQWLWECYWVGAQTTLQ